MMMRIPVILEHGVWVRWPGAANLSAIKVAQLVNEGTWTAEDYEPLGLAMALPFTPTQGKRIAGGERFEVVGDEVQQIFDEDDAPVPEVVSRRQFLMQLHIAGLTEQVEAWVGQQDPLVQIAYSNSTTFRRDEPMMLAGLAALGFTEQEILDFYSNAAVL